MANGLVLMTGFGPFGDVSRNPSGWIAEQLAKGAFGGVQTAAAVLPVTFAEAPVALERFINEHQNAAPKALLSLGVHPGHGFRLESEARSKPTSATEDNAGAAGFEGNPTGIHLQPRIVSFDLAELQARLAIADLSISSDAGGYVCDWVFQHLLAHGERLGIPALFLHVPPFASTTEQHLLEVTRKVAKALAAL